MRRATTRTDQPESIFGYSVLMDQELCSRWMPRKGTICARTPGHAPPCMTAENMANRRTYRRSHPHPESPESRKKSNRKYRISLYGLTQEQFKRLLEVQGHACGMCHKPFADGQLVHVDHDHGCCPEKNRSCGNCVRGLLCHTCNISLGHVERRYELARAYLDSPGWQSVVRAD
jgi:Recombination endonuclease VII